MDKVPAEHAFLDLSDYARPLARWLVQRLLPTSITPVQITIAFTVVGLAAAVLVAANRWLPVAGVLLLLKSTLDAADGSLARARKRPSRVGRFLDSVCDFVVMIAIFAGLGFAEWTRTGRVGACAVSLLAWLCASLQCSVFSYYYVRYRIQSAGDQTSFPEEAVAAGYGWDHPAVLAHLHTLYKIIYGWQDWLMGAIDRRIAPPDSGLHPAFMTATTVLGLGTQLLVIAVCAAIGRPFWAAWLFLTVFNVYWIVLVLNRWMTHADHHSKAI
jgi:phosphatidylglycerophosphate synthase